VSVDGARDSLAFVRHEPNGKAVVRFFDTLTGKIQTRKRFPPQIARRGYDRPLPLTQDQGGDLLAFVRKTKDAARVLVFTTRGKRVARFTVPRTGDIVVGNYLPSPGDELGFQRGEVLSVINPRSREAAEFQIGSGILVDHININRITKQTAPAGRPSTEPTEPSPPQGSPTDPVEVSKCRSVRPLPSSHIYKTIGSTHFSPSDVRRNTIGVVIRPGGVGPFPTCITAVDTKGNVLAKLGLYARGGKWAARYYAGIGCGTDTPLGGSAVAARAREATGSEEILLSFDSVCYGPFDASQCVGSSQC
jgi:hypothetical protein